MSDTPRPTESGAPTEAASPQVDESAAPTDAADRNAGPIAWMARNSIAANLLMVILLVGGIWTAEIGRAHV